MSVRPRPRILFLANCLPYPPHSGVTNRTYNILRQLAREFEVCLLSFSRRNHQADGAARRDAIAGLERIPITVAGAIPIAAERSRLRRMWDHLRSVTAGRAYTFYEFESGEFRRRLRDAVAHFRPDLIHVDSPDLYRWLADLPALPVACTFHNIESELLRLRARRLASPLVRGYMHLQAALVERVERRLAPRLQLNVMMSELDARRLRALAPGSVTTVIPNGADTDYFAPPPADQALPGRVAFLGPMYMFPNRDGVDEFLRAAWPRIRAGEPAATFEIIGRCGAADRARYHAVPGVAAAGYVPDLRPHLARARCSIVPLRIGGGTRLKILDAWAMGRAVVSTTLGCEGLDVVDGENILIRDTPEGFAAAVLRVLGDGELRARLERAGRRTAVETYSWDVVGRKLRDAYTRLLDQGTAARAVSVA